MGCNVSTSVKPNVWRRVAGGDHPFELKHFEIGIARKNKAKRKAHHIRKKCNRKRRQTERNANKVTIPDGYSTPLLKTFAYENPLACLTNEQRSAFAKCVGENAHPFGSDEWIEEIAVRNGLWSSLRPIGRPRKKDKQTVDT